MAEAVIKMPGMPSTIAKERGTAPGLASLDFSCLYTLSYIRNNTIRTTMLYFKEPVSIDIAVSKAKEFCKTKNANFSWLELAVNEITLPLLPIEKGD